MPPGSPRPLSSDRTLLIDGHVHIYPHYDILRAVRMSVEKIRGAAHEQYAVSDNDGLPVWLLAERADCDFFYRCAERKIIDDAGDIEISPVGDDATIAVTNRGEVRLYIIKGRQIVTRERLEILALCSGTQIKDRMKSAGNIIEDVLSDGGVPVLNWAPGKWFFSRGMVVKKLIYEFPPSSMLLGDTTLRHILWSEPALMSEARRRGFKIIAGSDPLPFSKEENMIGSYGFAISGKFDSSKPAESISSLLKDPDVAVKIIGSRNGIYEFCRRQLMVMTH